MTPQLKERLDALGLRHTSEALDDLIATATKRRWGPAELLEAIADEETKDRARRGAAHGAQPPGRTEDDDGLRLGRAQAH